MEHVLFNKLSSIKKPAIYLSVSVLATIVDIAFLVILIEFFELYYLIAVSISFIIAIVTKFILSRQFIFTNRPGTWITQFKKFFTVSINGLILTNICMFVGVTILNQLYLYVKLVVAILIFSYTLFFHNFYSFSKRSKTASQVH